MPLAAHTMPPPLRDGDRLTSDEFLRRWEAMPDLKHAELLEGIVYMPSPVSIHHADYHSPLDAWLCFYAVNTPGCRSSADPTWRMGARMYRNLTWRSAFCPSTAGSRGWKVNMPPALQN